MKTWMHTGHIHFVYIIMHIHEFCMSTYIYTNIFVLSIYNICNNLCVNLYVCDV